MLFRIDCSRNRQRSLRATSVVAMVAFTTLFCARASLAQFTHVVNVPPDVAPSEIGDDTQLNLFDGGELTSTYQQPFEVGSPGRNNKNVELNIHGGSVGMGVRANRGTVINVSGGVIGDGLFARTGSEVSIFDGSVGAGPSVAAGATFNFRGGTIGDSVYADDRSEFHVFGGDFRLNGQPLPGLKNVGDVQTPEFLDGVLTGVLEDGTPFAFSLLNFHFVGNSEWFSHESLHLHVTEVPAVGPAEIVSPLSDVPHGIRSGQTLIAESNGGVGNNFTASTGSRLILREGSSAGDNLEAFGAVVEIAGGDVGSQFDAYDGTTVNISAGSIDYGFIVHDATINVSGGEIASLRNLWGDVHLSGGSVAGGFTSFRHVDLYGAEFFFNGEPVRVAGGVRTIDFEVDFETGASSYSTLSGVFADGSPFLYSYDAGDLTAAADLFPPPPSPGVRLHYSEPPPIEMNQIVATVDGVPNGLRTGQTLIVDAGASINDNFTALHGSMMVVKTGGEVGSQLKMAGDVQLAGGAIGSGLTLLGSRADVAAGRIGAWSSAQRGSTVELSGGSIGESFHLGEGAKFSASAGYLGPGFTTLPGSQAEISGGIIGIRFSTEVDSEVVLIGNDFMINDRPVMGLGQIGDSVAIDLRDRDRLVGTLQDGTRFILSGDEQFDRIANGTLTLRLADVAPTPDQLMTLVDENAPGGIRIGQTLVVKDGGVVDDDFSTGLESLLVVHGGDVGDRLRSQSGNIRIYGGRIGERAELVRNSEMNVFGGEVGSGLTAYFGSTLNIHGGSIEDGLMAHRLSTVNLFGTEFQLDGVDITETLSNEVATVVRRRNVKLSGILADGSPFEFDLNPDYGLGDRFDSTATLTLTLSPGTEIMGDFNDDAVLDGVDIDLLNQEIDAETHGLIYDLTHDGIVTDDDRDRWVIELKQTWYGDANLDGRFDSNDLVAVFTAGQYEDDVAGDSKWSTGDWNGDGEFGSADLVTAFEDGGYDLGTRPLIRQVPEPTTATALLIGWMVVLGAVDRQRNSVRLPV